MNTYTEECTILSPIETKIRLEAWLMEAKYLQETDADDVFSFSFQPLTSTDHQRLFEAGEKAMMMVELSKSPYSNKVAKPCYENKYGLPFCSQLFKPKLNIKVEHPDMLYGKEVSIAAHFRDDPTGRVYLQADYVDVYARWDGEPMEPNAVSDDDDDW